MSAGFGSPNTLDVVTEEWDQSGDQSSSESTVQGRKTNEILDSRSRKSAIVAKS